MSSITTTVDIITQLDEVVSSYSFDEKAVFPLFCSPAACYIEGAIFSLMKEHMYSTTGTMGKYKSFSSGGKDYYVYRTEEHDWMVVSLVDRFAEKVNATMDDNLYRIIRFEKTIGVHAPRDFNFIDKAKVIESQAELLRKNSSHDGFIKIRYYGRQEFYLVHTADNQWWVINTTMEYGYQPKYLMVE